MKTAMQLMIWYLENEGLEESGAYYKAKMLLEKEKEQIIEAFEQGLEFGFPTNGSNYFNKTFNQNK